MSVSPVNATPNLFFRNVIPTDLPSIHSLESKSFPNNQAASRSKLQYRQHHAATFFRCAVLFPEDAPSPITRTSDASPAASESTASRRAAASAGDSSSHETANRHNSLNGQGEIIAYVSATRCQAFNDRSLASHDPTGPLLVIHSMVVSEPYRHRGIGSALLKNYLSYVSKLDLKHSIQKLVLIAKKDQLTFYVKEGGFRVMRQSNLLPSGDSGEDAWFECEREVGENINGPSRKKERRSECWVVDAFAMVGKNSGVGVVGMKGTGNPAAVVLVPAVIEEGVGDGGGGDAGGVSTTPSGGSSGGGSAGDAFFSQKAERGAGRGASGNINFTNDNSFLQDPDHEATISWMKMVAQEFNLSETAFIWEHAQPPKPTIQNSTDQTSPHEINEISQLSLTLPERPNHTLSEDSQESTSTPRYTIRFYTCDGSSVDLCGHATLAASTVVFKILSNRGMRLADMSVVFHAKNGAELGAKPSVYKGFTAGNGAGGLTGKTMKITMEFPWKELDVYARGSEEWEEVMSKLREAFFSVAQSGKSPNQGNDDGKKDEKLELLDEDVLCMGVDDGGDDLLVELNHVAFSKIPKPVVDINFRAMKELGGYARGIIICCAVDEFSRRRQEEQSLSHPSARASSARVNSDPKNGKKGGGGSVTVDFLSRFFGPKVGIEEDPVTGSAHCILGPYFSNKLGRETVVGKQMSHRGGIIECTPQETSESEKSSANKTVIISGSAVMVMSGMLYV